ncbi:MAG: hypothetical protein Q9218_003820 [Villophora microphyllina]
MFSRSIVLSLQTWWKDIRLDKDGIWFFAWTRIIVQFLVALLPLICYGDASTLVLTSSGTNLALFCGWLPRWKEEKWCGRENTKHDFCLLEGSGGLHVMVVCGNGEGWNFEDLAGGRVLDCNYIGVSTFVQILLWVRLLVAVAREEGQTWFLMTVGGVGILQNIIIAGYGRRASAFKFYLRKRKGLHHPQVRDALCQLEEEVPDAGCALRPIWSSRRATESDNEAFEGAVARRNRRRGQKIEASESRSEEATSSGRDGGEAGNIGLESRRTHEGEE